jgi:hypothetical protein
MMFQATTVETLDAADTPGVRERSLTHSEFNVKLVVDGNTTPAVSLVSEQTMGAAAGTIDFAAIPTTQGPQDAVGLRLKAYRIHNRGSHNFVLAAGVANGYALPGGVAITVPPGGIEQKWIGDALTTSDATHKTLDYTFDAADEADLTLIFGPPPA